MTPSNNPELHRSSFWFAGIAVLLLGAGTLVAQPTVNFNLDGVGSGTVLAGVYTSPYTASINSGPNTNVICDDFSDETYNPESWTAFVTPMASLTSTLDSTLQWSGASGAITIGSNTGSWNLTQLQAYDVAAVLATEILSAPTGSQDQQDLSYALWGLFYPVGTPTDVGAFNWLTGRGYTADASNALTDLKNAISYALNASNAAQVQAYVNSATIYSYDASAGLPVGCGGNCPPPPQEFITVKTPEASTAVIMAVDLLGFLALFGFLRKRSSVSLG